MAKFNMRSGNSPLFKQIGSSPAKYNIQSKIYIPKGTTATGGETLPGDDEAAAALAKIEASKKGGGMSTGVMQLAGGAIQQAFKYRDKYGDAFRSLHS